MACQTCKSSDKTLSQCSGCKATLYCSRECQKQDRPKHKSFCSAISQIQTVLKDKTPEIYCGLQCLYAGLSFIFEDTDHSIVVLVNKSGIQFEVLESGSKASKIIMFICDNEWNKLGKMDESSEEYISYALDYSLASLEKGRKEFYDDVPDQSISYWVNETNDHFKDIFIRV